MPRTRCLILAALLALCLSTGAAFAQDSWIVAGTGQDVPNALNWDESAPATVTATNNGTTTWDTTYGLASTAGATTQERVNRWGVTDVPVVGTVAPAADFPFAFDVVAPPISTVAYPLPVGVSPGVVAGFDNNYVVFNAGGLINTDVSANTTKITRFNDTKSGAPANVNFAFYIEELAGRVPVITTGYADGGFHPVDKVTRGAMAAFMQRSLELPLGTFKGLFSDVASSYGFALQIEACSEAGVAKGFADGTYKPTTNVKRNQMAVFLARGLTGGDAFIPSYLASDQTFSDVTVADFGYNAIEFCFDEGVTTGFKDGTFLPLNAVTRGQMSAFLYRAFIEPTASVVVLGGPAVTEVDTAAVDYNGWTSATSLDAANPGNAYVVFDAVRLASELVGDDSSFDVRFELTPAAGGAAIEHTVSLDAAALTAAHDAAVASGDPYFTVSWDMPALLADAYTLKVYVTNAADVENQAGRSVDLWVVPTTLSQDFEASAALPAAWTKVGPGAWTVGPVDLSGCNVPSNQGTTILAPGGENCLTVMPGGAARQDNPDVAAYSFTWVATPAVDCSAYTTVNLAADTLVSCYNDYVTLDVSNDDGATWTKVWELGYPDLADSNDTFPWHIDGDPNTWLDGDVVCPASPPIPDWWGNLALDISSIAAGSSRVKVRWTYVSDPAGCGCYGWFIDNVNINGS